MYKFDNDEKEITITQYNTPTPWINYLSNGTFHTMISQAGGGVAFHKSPQIRRINHYKFFHIPTDRSGFYTYIKDSDEYFCPTNEPCKTKPEKWSATHGMGYTKFESIRKGIKADTTYFVGEYENCLIWNLNLKNASIEDYPTAADPLTHYNKGCSENGSVFCHSNTWAIIAECMLGRGDMANKYYQQLLPMVAQEKAGAFRYKAEPYVYCSNIFGPESDKFGLANVSWLSGTAAWMYVAFTQYILGIYK